MKYNVCMYVQVVIKVTGVEADTPEEAVIATEAVDLERLLKNNRVSIDMDLPGDMVVQFVEYADGGIEEALVDPIGADGQPDESKSVELTAEQVYDFSRNKARSTAEQASGAVVAA